MTMVGDDDEEYFPRGGTSKKVSKKNSFVFGPKKASQEPVKKPGKRERTKNRQLKNGNRSVNEDEEDEDEDSEGDSEFNKIAKRKGEDVGAERSNRSKKVQLLSYQNIVEDMVVLCTVNSTKAFNKNRLQVALPERLLCSVDADDVTLTKSFGGAIKGKNNRPRFPKLGNFLVCRIKSCTRKQGDFEVLGSTNPAHIYGSLSFSDIHVGSVFLGAVKDTEDYGFLVFSGIRGVTAFLPFDNCGHTENANNLKNHFYVGKLIWCVVVQSKLGETTNTVKVSVKPEDFESHRISESLLTPQSVLPGMELDLTVTKHLGGDLEVGVAGTQVYGFVPRSHFPSLADNVTKFKIGSKLRGTVLYKYPISNIVAFSLRVNPLNVARAKVESGTVFDQAEIVYHDKRGLGVKFDHNGVVCYGIVSKRRMEGTVESDKFEEMFPRGNHLSIAVAGYHHIDQLYSCSTENDSLSGKLMGNSQKKEMVGKPVTVVVKEKTESGLKVIWGRTNASVPTNHISDVVGAKHVAKSIQVNSTQKGRVFQFNPQKNSLIVTLRPTLVNNKPLVDFAKVVKGDAYWGVVDSIFDSGINILFFNHLRTNIAQENLARDCRKYKIGELVKCFVIKDRQQNQQPVFSLLRPLDQMLLSIGTTYKLIVKSKNETGIDCLLEERKNVINVSIPLHHLSDHECLRKKTLEKLTPGTTVDAHLFCFDRNSQPVFTLRESVLKYFIAWGSDLVRRGYAALRPKILMPVILSEEADEGYYVSVPVPMFNRKILLETKEIKRIGNVSVGDVIFLVVSQVQHETQSFTLSYPDPKIFGNLLLTWAYSNLMYYLNEAASLQTFRLSQKVTATGNGVKNQCKLSDGRVGLIVKGKPSTYQPGQPVDLLFIEENLEKGFVHLLRPSERQADSAENQPPRPTSEIYEPFKVVFTSEMFYVGRSDSGAYCVFPRFLQPNSTEPDLYLGGDEIIEIQEIDSFGEGVKLGCPSLQIFQRIAQTKERKKKRPLGSISGKLGGSKKKAKTTFVVPSKSSKSTPPETGKFREKKKKKKSKKVCENSPVPA